MCYPKCLDSTTGQLLVCRAQVGTTRQREAVGLLINTVRQLLMSEWMI